MKKVVFVILSVIFLISAVSAELSVVTDEQANGIIAQLGNPAIFNFTFNNTGVTENVQLYSLVGMNFTPSGPFSIENGSSFMQIKAYASNNVLKNRGNIRFEYQMKTDNDGIKTDNLRIKVLDFNEAFSLEDVTVRLGDKVANVTLRNLENVELNNADIRFKSAFFDSTEKISIDPLESKSVLIEINSADVGSILTGNYVVSAELMVNGQSKDKIEGSLNYIGKEDVAETDSSSGFIIVTKTIEKKNFGNTKATTEIKTSKDVFTRLFTTYTPEPDKVDRNGLFVSYSWDRELNPGESFVVKVRTNYILPLILIILIVVVAFLVRMYTLTSVVVKKNVQYVKTKGGQFALRVRVSVKARKSVERVQLADSLPMGTKLYEKFGSLPHNIDHSSRRLIWNLSSIRAGEERVFTYIIYSDVKVVGNYTLPSATVSFERNGKKEQVVSNRTTFVSEQTSSNDFKK